MALYINRYQDSSNSLSYSKVILPNSGTDVLLVGTYGSEGTLARINSNGGIVWQKRYSYKGVDLKMGDGVACDNGDFILFGHYSISSSRVKYVLIRVNSSGGLIWSKAYNSPNTRFRTAIEKGTKDTYFFCGWYNKSGSSDDVEIIRIDGSGNVTHSNRYTITSDTQPMDMVITYQGNVGVIGGCVTGGTLKAYFLEVSSSNLAVQNARILDSGGWWNPQKISKDSSNNYIAVGNWRGTPQTFYMRFNPFSNGSGEYYNVLTSSEGGFTLDSLNGTAYFIVRGNNEHAICKKDLSGSGLDIRKSLSSTSDPLPIGIAARSSNDIFISGRMDGSGSLTDGFLASTDGSYDGCQFVDEGVPKSGSFTYTTSNNTPTVNQLTISVANLGVTVGNLGPNITDECCPNSIDLSGNFSLQSSYLYLQSAGSNGSDGSVKGFHLRWELMKELGEQHLPKGNLAATSGTYPTSIGFNKPDDFVRIYRVKPKGFFPITLDLGSIPNSIVDGGAASPERKWLYTGLISDPANPSNLTDVLVEFLDPVQYDIVKTTYNPNSNPAGFMREYGGLFLIETVGKLMFRSKFQLGYKNPGNPSRFRLETLSTRDREDTAGQWISKRYEYTGTGQIDPILCENIQSMRIEAINAYPTRVEIETYEDFIFGTNEDCAWEFMGGYSLDDGNSDSNANVFRQLEDTSQFTVHNQWPKYNEVSGGEFRVSVRNYEDRWLDATEGLKTGVVSYLTKSQTDVYALDTYNNSDPNSNNSAMDVSLLELLNFVSTDYHVARMLGLGVIDAKPSAASNDEWVYLAEYVTTASLGGNPATTIRHYHMAHPITINFNKYAPTPRLDQVSYGISNDNKTGNPTMLTDPDGYSLYGPSRYVNINRYSSDFERDQEIFFEDLQNFDLCNASPAVFFGIEYRDSAAGLGNFIRPEISFDPNYTDPGGLAEVMPIPNNGENPVYIHEETTTGVHYYALYSINWFSRTGNTSSEVPTDFTSFPPFCPIIPPSGFNVQLIQPESPPLFSTLIEQGLLSGIGSSDKTLVRALFDWNHLHNAAYQFADKVQVFFRENDPLIVRGKITSVSINTTDHTATLTTTGYTIYSQNPNQVVTPVVNSGDVSRFIGGNISIDGETYTLEDVLVSGTNPTLLIKQIRKTHLVDPNNNNVWCVTESWEAPDTNANFTLVENLNQPVSWDSQLVKEINLTNFGSYTETVNYPDGSSESFVFGGITDNCSIAHVWSVDPGDPPNTPTGVYTLNFNTQSLSAHPQADVEYYLGTVRVPIWGTSERKVLKLISIDQTSPQIQVKVFDPDFTTDSIIPNSGGPYTNVPVNFHPSYRCYFYADLTGSNNFGEAAILPAPGTNLKTTYMASRAIDSSGTCTSPMTVPTGLIAIEIVTPMQPGSPTGPDFATRPDYYGKSTYTFDTDVELFDGPDPREPHAMVFYRANERSILEALYTPATILTIRAAIPPNDPYAADRWRDLVAFNVETSGPNINEFLEHSGYRLPNPDNNDVDAAFTGSAKAGTILGNVKDAIHEIFVPLTKNPVIYEFLKADPGYTTSSRKPKITDLSGNPLPPVPSSGFDPTPMVRLLPLGGGTPTHATVRFTDYTLDGSSRNVYFYFAREMGNNLSLSPPSDITGPIALVDSMPASKPEILSVTPVPGSLKLRTSPYVSLSLNDYVPSENVKRIRLYRTNIYEDSFTVRTMVTVDEVDVGTEVVDRFTDLGLVPYCDTLYYRVIALREIVNEQGNPEFVPSQPSEPVLTSIIDTVSPPAPEISYTVGSTTTGPPLVLNNVYLTWPESTYKGKYYLYKETSNGNWQKIYEVDGGNGPMDYPPAADFSNPNYQETIALAKEDSDGNTIFHRFRVGLESNCGKENIVDKILII